MKYSIDTSSIIEPWRRIYPPDIFGPLWDLHLPELISRGDMRATDEVIVELEQQDDEILGWAQAQEDLFVPMDTDIQNVVTEILREYPKLIDPNAGRSGADPFVIALAQINNSSVVTQERPRSMANPKIPDVCGAMRIRCINLLDVIREEGWTFR